MMKGWWYIDGQGKPDIYLKVENCLNCGKEFPIRSSQDLLCPLCKLKKEKGGNYAC